VVWKTATVPFFAVDVLSNAPSGLEPELGSVIPGITLKTRPESGVPPLPELLRLLVKD
jgi:hypothetical protein